MNMMVNLNRRIIVTPRGVIQNSSQNVIMFADCRDKRVEQWKQPRTPNAHILLSLQL